MKAAILYASRGGGTKKIASVFREYPVFDVKDSPDVSDFDCLVILCPAAGDRELPLAMEDFILSIKDVPRKYALCEMGDSAGYHYEGPGMGPGVILHTLLSHWEEVVPPFELETTPKVTDANWARFLGWKYKVVEYVEARRYR